MKNSSIIALREYREFRLLWIGQLISQVGTQMQVATINYHIYILTGSPIALGLTGLVRVVPIVVFSLMGGVFADAHDRRRVLFVTQSLMMIFSAILAITTSLHIVSVGIIYLMAALTSASFAFDNPARQSMIPNLVKPEHLTNALSLNNVMMQTASIAGPALFGFVVSTINIAAVYWFNAVSFIAVIVALAMMRPLSRDGEPSMRITMSALTEGIRFVISKKIILGTMLLDFFATFFSSASALLPIMAQEILHVDAVGLGILYSAESAGAVVAGVAVARRGTIKRQGSILLISVALYGLATILFGASKWFLFSFLFLAGVGAADTVSTILRNTIRQLTTPDYIRGRMTSVNMVFFMGGPQLGNLEAGIVAALFGAPISVISGGVATVILTGLMWKFMPFVRQYKENLTES